MIKCWRVPVVLMERTASYRTPEILKKVSDRPGGNPLPASLLEEPGKWKAFGRNPQVMQVAAATAEDAFAQVKDSFKMLRVELAAEPTSFEMTEEEYENG